MSAAEANARAVKAAALADTLEYVRAACERVARELGTADPADFTADTLVTFAESMSWVQWCDLAEKAGVRPPSPETREVVLSILRRRAEPADNVFTLFPKRAR